LFRSADRGLEELKKEKKSLMSKCSEL
jgi:hypothetical protein